MTVQHDIYPMPTFAGLEVADTGASRRWYMEALGFADIFTMPDGPGGMPMLVHLRFTKYADILLRPALAPSAGPKGLGISLTFTVFDGGLDAIDALAERARKAGAVIVQEPGNRPWNARDFTVADPDGFRLTFTKGPVNTDLTFAEVMDRAGKPA
ncbi:MAG: VOC family protein [Bauldia sp.]|nr:VOC family protein [Bauldia sp.]